MFLYGTYSLFRAISAPNPPIPTMFVAIGPKTLVKLAQNVKILVK
jgi:hypothetical protein